MRDVPPGHPRSSSASCDMTDFGYARVSPQEKGHRVRRVFDRVARRYDIMNDLMSAGHHRRWKQALVDEAAPQAGMRILDLAGGTGDIALRLGRALGLGRHTAAQETPAQGPIYICDINAAMIDRGRSRLCDRGVADGVAWIVGDGECLPLPGAGFDLVTLAFGLRNMTDKAAALKDIHRVLRPGGRFVCLEFSRPDSPFLRAAYDLYSSACLPALGRVVAGDRAAYRYLIESIRMFPDRDRLADMIKQSGFTTVYCRPLSGGIVAIHVGERAAIAG